MNDYPRATEYIRLKIARAKGAVAEKDEAIVRYLAMSLISYRTIAELENITASAAYYRYGSLVKEYREKATHL
jgi:hypothetical protein